MKYLEGEERKIAERYCNVAELIATASKCKKAQHGAVITLGDKILGIGYNSPVPDNFCNPCMRQDIKGHTYLELCNSVHAEENAILCALKKHHILRGAHLYHARMKNNEVVRKNIPSCTTCSRLILHEGLEGVVLIQEEGFALYSAEEFNRLSYEYHTKLDKN